MIKIDLVVADSKYKIYYLSNVDLLDISFVGHIARISLTDLGYHYPVFLEKERKTYCLLLIKSKVYTCI